MQVITADDIDFAFYANETETRQKVRAAKTYVQALIDRMNNPVKEKQVVMPWGKTHRLIQFRGGEVTIWGGQNGTGKSLALGQCVLSFAAQEERTCIASFEMKPMKTLERMGRQFTGFDITDSALTGNPKEMRALQDRYEEFRDWSDNRLWLYDQQGTVHWKQVCAVARYCAKELQITQFVVDNMMKCVAGEDDFNGQKAFIDELTAIARDYDMHIHVVHHVKKPQADDHKPTKYDLKGSGAISDQADNVVLIWRNKVKERLSPTKRAESQKENDALLIVDKQRNGSGWEGYIGLFYERRSQQFLAKHDDTRMTFYQPPVEEFHE